MFLVTVTGSLALAFTTKLGGHMVACISSMVVLYISCIIYFPNSIALFSFFMEKFFIFVMVKAARV